MQSWWFCKAAGADPRITPRGGKRGAATRSVILRPIPPLPLQLKSIFPSRLPRRPAVDQPALGCRGCMAGEDGGGAE